jgi:hypothetical protein
MQSLVWVTGGGAGRSGGVEEVAAVVSGVQARVVGKAGSVRE